MYRFQSPVAVASVPLELQAGVRKPGHIHGRYEWYRYNQAESAFQAQNRELYQEPKSFGLLAFSTLQNLSLKAQ